LGTAEAADEATAMETAAAEFGPSTSMAATYRTGCREAASLKNGAIVRAFTNTMPIAPRTYSIHRDDSGFVVFCFTKPDDAEALPSDLVGSFASHLKCKDAAPEVWHRVGLGNAKPPGRRSHNVAWIAF
jgi:hypothetical protein